MNPPTINKCQTINMVHFQQQSAHVHKTEYMNFSCDASSSPLSSGMGAFLHKTHYWLAFPGGGTSPQQSEGPGTKTKLPESDIVCGSSRIDWKKKSALKYCSFCLNSHLGVSACRRAKECAQLGASSAAARSRAVPQRPLFQKPGILLHKTWYGSIKKLLSVSTTFLVTFGKRYLHLHWTSDIRKEQITRSSSDLDGGVYLCLYRSVIN